jgi:hypothetical protein
MSERHALEVARRELQRLGYLNHRVERFLLSDALSPAGEPRAFALLSAKVGLLAGSLLAFANALALGIANDLFRTAPADLLPLFAHLWPPLVLAAALGFVAAAGGFLFAIRLFPRRSLELMILVVAFVATGALFGWALFRARDLLLEIDRAARVAMAVALPLLAAGIAKLVANGLLSLAIRLTRLTPRQRLVSRRTILGVIGATLGILLVVAFAWPETSRVEGPAALPRAPGEPVALVGLDGILPDEIDYLLARGALPAIARRLASEGGGGAIVPYERGAAADPAELWTRFATGVEAARHGVGAIDGDRPVGLRSTLLRSGPWSLWWRYFERPLGLSEHRPVLANRRRAFAFWELAGHGGEPAAAINWWATFPAQPGASLVVAHGGFQLLGGSHRGAVEPAEAAAELAQLAAATTPGPFGETLAAALPPDLARATLERAILPDRFYREVARRQSGAGALALYLPAIDLVAEGWLGGDVALADLVRTQLVETDALVSALGDRRTILLLADPGRRGGGSGRAILLRAGCAAPAGAVIRPVEAASILLRSFGLPQSAELAPPPSWPACAWPAPPATVAGFGEPRPAPDAPAASGEYLENLRSLGYL